MLSWNEIEPGAALPEWDGPVITPELLRRYAAVSGDHNPLHTDAEQARAAGFPDVIGHGMLGMGLLSPLIDACCGPGALRSFAVRFQRPIRLGDRLRCGGTVLGKDEAAGRVRCAVHVLDHTGQIKLSGHFEAVIPRGASQP